MQSAKNPELIQDSQEISLLDILDFFKKSWKIIALGGFLGLIIAAAYLFLTPKQYEATAQIKMAQISLTNPTNPFGTSVEDPASLIARMQFPTNYDNVVINACGFQDKVNPALALSKSVKLSVPKGIANTVELKTYGKSPELAKNCAQAIVDLIASLQTQFAKPFVEEAKLKLAQDNERIESARRLIAKADQSGSAMSAAYLSARDELTYFLTDREKMLDLINSVQQRGTRLTSPIYTPEIPSSPKRATSLAIGLFAGLALGLMLALGRQFGKKIWQRENVGARP